MSIDRHIPGGGLQRRDTLPRLAPRCYSQQAMSKAASTPHVDAESSAVLVGLSIIACVAVVLVAYGGWSF